MKFLTNCSFGICSLAELHAFDFMSYGLAGGRDIVLAPEDYSVAGILANLPKEWQPDCAIFFYPEYEALPRCMEEMPFPSYAVVSDWNCGFLSLRETLKTFDHIFTDTGGVRLFKAIGYENVSYWPVYSFNKTYHSKSCAEEKRYDVTFIGNLNFNIHWQRNQLLFKLLTLSDRYTINVEIAVRGREYGKLQNQSKIVFNKTVRGECNMRCYEALASGSLLFVEDDNLEVREFFRDREEVVMYNSDNLLELVQHYLANTDELQRIAEKGHSKVQAESYPNHLHLLLKQISDLSRKSNRREQISGL